MKIHEKHHPRYSEVKCIVSNVQRLVKFCIVVLIFVLSIAPRKFSASVGDDHQGLTILRGKFPSNAVTEQQNDFLSEFHICQPGEWDSYVCQGVEYEAFGDKLESLVRSKSYNMMKPSQWGKRPSPFPANATILAIGNSHTRQVMQALLCQYSGQSKITDMESGSNNVMRRGSHYVVEYDNNAKLTIITNHALFYSKHWLRYLEDLIQQPVATLDGLVLGKINGFAEAYNTSFMEVMKEKTAQYEDADLTTNPPPSLLDIAELYHGPIVAHSMFADWGGDYLHWEMMEAYATIQQRQSNKAANIQIIQGRQYIGDLGECSSDSWQGVGVCGEDGTAHRCIGHRGGHPDLIAWDVIESMYALLSTNTVHGAGQ